MFPGVKYVEHKGEDGQPSKRLVSRWYFGGLATAGAACFTHPLDLLKVLLQTQQDGKLGLVQMAVKVCKSDGILGLYSGLSASLLRQLIYSSVRFGVYEAEKQMFAPGGDDVGFGLRVAMATFSGACGGVVGTPFDLVNVRMQNDTKLPPEKRRNYKHVVDGLYRVSTEEGPMSLMKGCSMLIARSIALTVGQIAFYDQFKTMLMNTGHFEDNVTTHFTASILAAVVAASLTQPVDVMKTRLMNAKPGEFSGLAGVFWFTAREGPMGFFKGYIPSSIRLAPQTILTFIFYEQLRLNFGKEV